MAIILVENLLRTATASSIGTVGGTIDALKDGRTSTTEAFATGATREFKLDNTTAKTVNCLGVARHNLASVGGTIAVEGSSDDATYTPLFSVTPTNNNIILSDQSDYSYRYYKIKISGHSANVTASDVAIGDSITLERDQKFGFIAPEFADGDQVLPNITRGQNLVGLSVKEGLKKIKLQLPYYTSAFYAANWATIIDGLKKYPIYLNWKSNNSAVPFYCWPSKNLPQAKYSANVSGYAYLDAVIDLEGITS